MPLAGLVLNRVHTTGASSLSAARSAAGAETLEEAGEHPVTAGILRLHAERMRMIEREQSLRGRFTRPTPQWLSSTSQHSRGTCTTWRGYG